jgi:ribosomal protein S18 acetylase RimI-like enzyme
MAKVTGESSSVRLRPALGEDVADAVPLLFESGRSIYPRLAGSEGAARRVLSAAFRRHGTTASCEVVTLAEVDGRIAGAMAAFPVAEGGERARRFLATTLARTPPWRWPRVWRTFHALRPQPPASALYVDSLATDPALRRRGVARALLAAAGQVARERGLPEVALETELDNSAARALYRSAGFEEVGELRPADPGLGEGYVCLVHTLDRKSAPAAASGLA